VVGFLLSKIACPIYYGFFNTITMKKIFEKYGTLPKKQQLGVAIIVFIFILLLLPNTIAYSLGLLASYKLIGRRDWRYTAVSILSIITFFSAILWVAGDVPTPTNDRVIQKQEVIVEQEEIVETEEEINTEEVNSISIVDKEEIVSKTSVPEAKKQETAEEEPNPNKLYKVSGVVDGDTVKLSIEGKIETIRLIGIDTPETVHPSKPVECFGVEASNKAKQLLSGKTVSLETDASQGTRDRFGRLLGYIILADGTNFNKLMIEQGYAYEYTYSTSYKYQSEFKSAQQYAKANSIGLWADGVCEEKEGEIENTQNNQPKTVSGGKWYVSAHHSSRYYYCEESDGWGSLSEKNLKVYNSEASLLDDFPSHTLHESCR